jgi:hypothetical protein
MSMLMRICIKLLCGTGALIVTVYLMLRPGDYLSDKGYMAAKSMCATSDTLMWLLLSVLCGIASCALVFRLVSGIIDGKQ